MSNFYIGQLVSSEICGVEGVSGRIESICHNRGGDVEYKIAYMDKDGIRQYCWVSDCDISPLTKKVSAGYAKEEDKNV